MLRHTFASILIYQGRDVAFVARQLGHTTPSTTWDTYVHLFNAAKQADEAREQLDAEFGSVLEREADDTDDGRHRPAEPTAADRLGALRERGGLSGQDIASLLGASEQTVSRWRTGKGEPRRSLAEHLAELEQLVGELAATRRPHEVRDALLSLTGRRWNDDSHTRRESGANTPSGNKQGTSSRRNRRNAVTTVQVQNPTQMRQRDPT